MPKSISIYLPDQLVEKMDELREVNWSEIARQSIEEYITKRKRYDEIGLQIEKYLKEAEYLTYKLQKINEERGSPPLQLVLSNEITCTPVLRFWRGDSISKPLVGDQSVDIMFHIRNNSKEEVITDRIWFVLDIIKLLGPEEQPFVPVNENGEFIGPNGEKREEPVIINAPEGLTTHGGDLVIETIAAVHVCKRQLLSPNDTWSSVEPLRISEETLKKIAEMASKKENNIRWEIQGKAFFENRKGVIEVKANSPQKEQIYVN